MKRFLRRAAVMMAATSACAAMLPAAGAYATLGPAMSPCDNEPLTTPTASFNITPIGAVVQIQITLNDVFVRFDSPNDGLDAEVGADLQNLNFTDPLHPLAVCFEVFGNGTEVSIDLVNLTVTVCNYNGQPYVLTNCTVIVI